MYCGPGSAVGIATGYGTGRSGDRIPVWARFSPFVQTGPGAHPASCTMGTGSFLGVKSGRGVTLTPYPLLVSWSRKGRVIPLLPLWAVRPVQSLSDCTRVTFTLRVLSTQIQESGIIFHYIYTISVYVMRKIYHWDKGLHLCGGCCVRACRVNRNSVHYCIIV